MKNFEVRKFIAVLFAVAFVIYIGYGLMTGKEVSRDFLLMVSSVVGYYFGKSTALETK